jgi:anthranilate phosphoribosyltransferase
MIRDGARGGDNRPRVGSKPHSRSEDSMNLIDRVLTGNFEVEEMEQVIDGLLTGALAPAAAAGVLVALRSMPVTPRLLVAGAQSLRRRSLAVPVPSARHIVDTCGTGGGTFDTVNISTGAAMLVAACDGTVAKQGHRAVSGKCGSADVIEALGLPVDIDPVAATRAMEDSGFAFLMASRYHVAVGNIMRVRRQLGIPTLFNLLLPLANPANPTRQLVGVYHRDLTEPMARALGELGSERALVVHCDGIGEIGLHADTTGHLWADGRVTPFRYPGRGIPLEAIAGGDAQYNARVLRRTFDGRPGPVADAIAINAGAALWLLEILPTFEECVAWARQRLGQGVDVASFRPRPRRVVPFSSGPRP